MNECEVASHPICSLLILCYKKGELAEKNCFQKKGSSGHKNLSKNTNKKESHENKRLVYTTLRVRGKACEQGGGEPAGGN